MIRFIVICMYLLSIFGCSTQPANQNRGCYSPTAHSWCRVQSKDTQK